MSSLRGSCGSLGRRMGALAVGRGNVLALLLTLLPLLQGFLWDDH